MNRMNTASIAVVHMVDRKDPSAPRILVEVPGNWPPEPWPYFPEEWRREHAHKYKVIAHSEESIMFWTSYPPPISRLPLFLRAGGYATVTGYKFDKPADMRTIESLEEINRDI
jgi:hypothetical protein